jgi:hypothetical protein
MRLVLLPLGVCLAACTVHTYEPAPQPAPTTIVVPPTPGSVGTVVTTPPPPPPPGSTIIRSP